MAITGQKGDEAMTTAPVAAAPPAYPVRLSIDPPAERERPRLSALFRVFLSLPIFIVLAALQSGRGGFLILGPLLMILFKQKYPRWWFDFNLELARFVTRVDAYLFLLTDTYPSTVEEQSVHLDIDYPDVERDLNRWYPLVKWILAIPHYVVLALLWVAAYFVVILAWFSIVITGKCPEGLFTYLVGVLRWTLRVESYAFLLTTDRYPPFSLE